MYVEEWKQARKSFEAVTLKKKPCEKFLGVFNKSTGIAAAVKGLDEALGKADPDKMEAAEKAFLKVVDDYVPILIKAAKADPSPTYVAEVEKLGKALQEIGVDYAAERQDTNLKVTQAKTEEVLKLFTDLHKAIKPCKEKANTAKRQAILDHGVCSDALAAIASANAQGDTSAVKVALADIASSIKSIEAAIKLHDAAAGKLRVEWRSAKGAFDKAKSELNKEQVKGVQAMVDRTDEEIMVIGTLIDTMRKELEDSEEIAKDAAAAANDASKSAALLEKSAAQLAVRADKLYGSLKQATLGVDGALDLQDIRIGDELEKENDPQRKKKISDNIRMKIEGARADADRLLGETRDNMKQIYLAIGRMPSQATGLKAVQKQLDVVRQVLTDLEAIEKAFEKSLAKADKLLKKL